MIQRDTYLNVNSGSPMSADDNWRPIPGYAGYFASREGEIRGPEGMTLRPLMQYPRVRVRPARATPRKAVPVHTLVALAFHGERPAGAEIDHINCNPLDARAENLRYVSGELNRERRANVSPNALKTHCKRGHAFDEANTYAPLTGPAARYCRTCRRDGRQRRALARRATAPGGTLSAPDTPNQNGSDK